MTQIAVSLTDYGLAAECAVFACIFAQRPRPASSFASDCILFFFSIALAAAIGGTVHGFFPNESSLGYRILWSLTLILMGMTALAAVRIGTALQFTGSVAAFINRGAVAVFAVYAFVVVFVRSDFRVAIIGYLPSLVFVGVVFLTVHLRNRKPRGLAGFSGACVMLVAAAAQQAKIGIDPRFFDYNAVYHVLQAIALFMIFLATRESSQPTA